jgi:hypothetical protein
MYGLRSHPGHPKSNREKTFLLSPDSTSSPFIARLMQQIYNAKLAESKFFVAL